MAGNAASHGVSVTSRTLGLLAAFDGDHRELTLTELATRAELTVPTAFRLLAELVAWGALERLASGRYVIGRRLWHVGLLAPVHAGLRQIASPFLHDLYGATLATVHLAERDGTRVLYLDHLSGHASVAAVSQTGARLPLHATAVGKVLLAHAPGEVQREVMADLTRVTPYTIVQPGRLGQELQRVRRDVFAQTHEEMTLGASSVAVPILDPSGSVVAALGLVVARLGRDRPRLVAALEVAARGVGRSLAAATSAG